MLSSREDLQVMQKAILSTETDKKHSVMIAETIEREKRKICAYGYERWKKAQAL